MKLNSVTFPSYTSISSSSSSSNPALHHPSIFKPKSHLSSPRPSSSSLTTTVRWHHRTSPLSFRAHNPKKRLNHFADLASKLALDGRFQDFLIIAETVVGSGICAKEFVGLLNLDLFSKGVVRIVEDGGKVGSFVEVLNGAEKLGIRVLDLLDGSAVEAIGRELSRMSKCGQVEEVVDLMEVLAGFHFSIKELVEPSEIIRICVCKRKPNAAIRYACFSPHTDKLFTKIILEFGNKRDIVSALIVFKASKHNLGCNMYAYRAMIDVCGLCGDHLLSRSIYEELLTQKVTPNIHVFNTLMNVNAHDLSYTTNIHKHMKNLGIVDMTSYNIILKSCSLAGRVDLAQDIYREVQLLESNGLLKLDVFTYSTIVKVFSDAKLWQMALEVKTTMLAAGITPNTITWSALISACANAGLVNEAFKLFDEMVQAGCVPNSQCCNILLHACVEAHQYDRAFRLFQSLKTCGKTDNLKNFGSTQNFASNLRGLNHSKKIQFAPTTSTYNILMKACGTDYHRAKALIDEMRNVGLSPNQISWSTLIGISGGSGSVKNVMQILKSMSVAGIQPDVVTYTAAIKVCVESKDLKVAYSLFAEMKRFQVKPNMMTYNTLLRARSRYGSLEEVQQCLGVYRDMRRAGYKSNDYFLRQLIEEWCEGILQDNHQHQGQLRSSKIIDPGNPHSVLLETVALHLEKNEAETLSIDLRGLTKVEARIVILAVLRMIKENYTPGDIFRDDMFIILGIPKTCTTAANDSLDVKDTIIKLLRDDLGLDVLLAGQATTDERKETPLDQRPTLNKIVGTNSLPTELGSPVRRPAVIQRLKVTKSSLYRWLKRRLGFSNK